MAKSDAVQDSADCGAFTTSEAEQDKLQALLWLLKEIQATRRN